MPTIHQSAKIAVEAPAEVAFDLVTSDLMKLDDDPDAMRGQRPLDDGPVREGFRWQQRLVHNRKVCTTKWRITKLARPCLIEQAMVHFCADAQVEVRGGERWEFRPGKDGQTLVRLGQWRRRTGLTGWIQKLFVEGPSSVTAFALSRRLAYVQFEAERRWRAGA